MRDESQLNATPLSIDPVDFIPTSDELGKATKETALALQEKTKKAFSRPKTTLRRIKVDKEVGNRIADNNDTFGLCECVCVNAFDRCDPDNKRTIIAQLVLQCALQFISQSTEPDQPLRIAAIASGFLLNELFLLTLLVSNNIRHIQFDLVDCLYVDPTDVVEAEKALFHSESNLSNMIYEFLMIAHFGLGLKIELDESNDLKACALLSTATKNFSQKATVLTDNPDLLSGRLRLSFFSSVAAYDQCLFAQTQRSPKIIYDVDFSPPITRSAVVEPVKKVVSDSCVWFFAVRSGKDEVLVGHEIKVGQDWVSQTTSSDFIAHVHHASHVSGQIDDVRPG